MTIRGTSVAEPVLIAESPGMRRVVMIARRFALTSLPVLLVGETGTGKEVVAQAIHRWSGRPGDLVDVDCGALSSGMVVAELFGHRRGAYTTAIDSMPGLVEQANRGTLFLDELTSLAAEGQAALLRVLETGEVRRVGDRIKHQVDLRMVAAVQPDGNEGRGLGSLRTDLFHRLAGTVIHLPPLRNRPEELLPLASHFASLHQRSVASTAAGVLERHQWTGNVRELRNVIGRAVFLTDDYTIGSHAIAEALDLDTPVRTREEDSELRVLRHREMLDLCRRHSGRPELMAVELGVSRSTLYRRLREAGITLREAGLPEWSPV
jgi:DNA-binding NtrC family response regulator